MFDALSSYLLIAAMLVLLTIALASDVRERRIPNRLVVTGLLLGLTGHSWLTGVGGFVFAGTGALVGLLCLLPFYISGGLAAGDVKLMAMCGAFLGPLQAVLASVASLLVGGVIGVVWAFWQFGVGTDEYVLEDELHASSTAVGQRVTPSSAIPYALAIVAGVLITLKAAPMILFTLKQGVSL